MRTRTWHQRTIDGGTNSPRFVTPTWVGDPRGRIYAKGDIDTIVNHYPKSEKASKAAGTTDHTTYCRICDAGCGLLATVTDGRITDIRSDKDNPHSQGFMCRKPKANVDVVYDPDRLLTPMKRIGEPAVEPCSWDEALDAIATRLGAIVEHHGGSAFATYIGNPAGGFSSTGPISAAGLAAALGSSSLYDVVGEGGPRRVRRRERAPVRITGAVGPP